MTSNSSWVPDEDAQALFSERCWLQAVIITAIAYGITVSLYFSSFYRLVREQNHLEFKRRLLLLVSITITFLLGTLTMIGLAGFTQMILIDDRNYPGGPIAFEISMFSTPINMVGNVAGTISNWLSDALVVWRFKIIYQNSSCRVPLWIVMFFPCLLFSGSVSMGIVYLTTNPYYTTGGTDPFVPPCATLSLGLNIILTIAIVLRLLIFRYRIVSLMGQRYGTQYTSAAAMVIESAALYSVMSVAFLVLFGIESAVSLVFAHSLTQFQTIATLLIVFRVAEGKGWTQNTGILVGSDPSQSGSMQLPSPRAPVTSEISA